MHQTSPRLSEEARRSERFELARDVRAHAAALDDDALASLRELLWADVSSEYDARFLAAYLERLPFELSSGFRAAAAAWEVEERDHSDGFRTVYAAAFPEEAEGLEQRLRARADGVDFGPLRALFADEFTIACLIAYDELATVRAYRANRSRYALLGPRLTRFVGQVTADEGRHFAAFLHVLRRHHAERLGEAPRVIDLLRASEGVPYANTFVLDHDDDVWSDALFDDAADTLRRRLHP